MMKHLSVTGVDANQEMIYAIDVKGHPISETGMNRWKVIHIESAWKSPLSVQDLILYPPKGYKFTASRTMDENLFRFLAKYDLSYKLQTFMGNVIPLQLFRSEVNRLKSPPKGSILTYSLCHLVIRKEPWILDMANELPYLLAWNEKHLRRYRERIRRILASEYCKKIICRVEKGREAFLATFGEEFAEKTETVYWGAPPKNFIKNYEKGKVKILFVNTGNISTTQFTASHFCAKGGLEVLDAFVKISEKWHNVELVVRSTIPKRIKEKYRKYRNIKFICNPIPWSMLEKEWKSADIFVLPNHGNTPAMVFYDAMSYELPIISTDTWANPELIRDGETGFLVHDPISARYTRGSIIYLNDPQFKAEVLRGPHPRIVEEIAEKITILIENPELRKKMGIAARREIEYGKFSLRKRNDKLKKILDEVAIQN